MMESKWQEIWKKSARETKMPYGGQYKGRTLEDIAKTDEGLLFLDRQADLCSDLALRELIRDFLSEPVIANELNAIFRRQA